MPATPPPRRLTLACLASAAILAACASAAPVGSRMNPNAAPVAAAGFRLDGFRVAWQDNPGFRTSFNYMVPKSTPNAPPPENIKQRAQEHVGTILKHFREEAVPQLTTALMEHKVPAGATHRVVLTPMSAFQDTAGWGTRITVRATVVDANNKVLWHSDIESHSGLQWFGPVLSRPDASYVHNYTAGLIETMRKAGLLGAA